jgi:hypothetical protein
MILIEFIAGYWTLVINGQPTMSCVSFERAIYWMEELLKEMQS